jgi:acetoin utilization protein AcuB
MKAIPQISKYMTVHPHTIGVEQSLSKAHIMMNEFKIRHLPVLDGGTLVGIISDRDIKAVMTFKDVNPDTMKVSEALTEDPFTVKPTSALDEVCAEMGAHKFGSALVVDNGKLVGIFTWVDALNALTELLGTRLKK